MILIFFLYVTDLLLIRYLIKTPKGMFFIWFRTFGDLL